MRRNIDKILKLKYTHIILSLCVLFTSYLKYIKRDFGFFFWSGLILGLPYFFIALYSLINKEETKDVE